MDRARAAIEHRLLLAKEAQYRAELASKARDSGLPAKIRMHREALKQFGMRLTPVNMNTAARCPLCPPLLSLPHASTLPRDGGNAPAAAPAAQRPGNACRGDAYGSGTVGRVSSDPPVAELQKQVMGLMQQRDVLVRSQQEHDAEAQELDKELERCERRLADLDNRIVVARQVGAFIGIAFCELAGKAGRKVSI